jgi:thiol-disulfide isomerase/thioredoxin
MLKIIAIFTCLIFYQCHIPEKKIDTNIPEPVKKGIRIGEIAPDISYPDPEGKMLSLYSLRGKIVLIDFWASWCPPCRRENPNLVSIYKDFRDKKFKTGDGFTVFSISCDRTKEEWTNAIKKDQLIWKNHVSDLKGWEAEATYIFNISAIPSNVLIDGRGVILAKDLHGETLRAYLDSLLIK